MTIQSRSRERAFVRIALLALLCLMAVEARASDRASRLNLEGHGGLINTPTAFVLREGWAQFLTTQQKDPQYRAFGPTNTYILATTFLPYLEAAARITEVELRSDDPRRQRGGQFVIRDLSLNVKLQLPLQLLWPNLPVAIAVGGQDEGGAAPHFRTRYAVASANLWRFGLSAGWGTGPDRMSGVFGGASLRLTDWAELLAEYDTEALQAGVRIQQELRLGPLPLQLAGLLKTSLTQDAGRLDVGFSLGVPLDITQSELALPDVAVATPALEATPDAPRDPLRQLQNALVKEGFENVRVGRDGSTLLIEYENNVYNHSQADGLAAALAIARTHTPKDTQNLAVTLKRSQLPIVEITADPSTLEETLALDYSPPGRPNAVYADRNPQNPSRFHTRLILGPGLRTFVATEVSNFDAVLSLRPEALINLWPGASLYGRWDLPFAWTNALGDDGPLRFYRGGPRLEHGLLQQAFKLPRGLLGQVSAGLYRVNTVAALGEVTLPLGNGEHAFGLQAAYGRNLAGASFPAYTASYRGWFTPLSLAATLRAGQFYAGDRGATFELSRFFGDTEVGAFYTRTYTDTSKSILGVYFSLPLTPRKDMRPGYVQVTGSPRWGQQVQTVVQETRNDLTSGVGVAPLAPRSIEGVFLDEGRLNRGAILEGLRRSGAIPTLSGRGPG